MSTSFSPDDRTIAIGSTNTDLSFFGSTDLSREGTHVQFQGVASGRSWAFYTPEGDVAGLAPYGHDATNERWFVFRGRTDELLTAACQLAGADITHAQWSRYVGNRPYEPVCGAQR